MGKEPVLGLVAARQISVSKYLKIRLGEDWMKKIGPDLGRGRNVNGHFVLAPDQRAWAGVIESRYFWHGMHASFLRLAQVCSDNRIGYA